jgi:hypothetical protein
MYIFCVFIYVIIFRALSFEVIIFHGQQMLSFLFYFPLYIFCVIIYVIIYCYHDIYIMKNYNILYTQKGQHLKNDNILYD